MKYSAIIARQREFFHSGATRSLDFRRAQLQKLANLLETREAELLVALHADLRKSPHEAYVSEIGFVLGEIRHALRHLRSWMKPERRRSPVLAWPAHSHIHPEPYGVALIIGPWNYPLQLLLSPLVGAIAAGNCAILKPSEFAPHTAAVVDEMIRPSFAEDYLTIIRGERETSEALLREKFDTIFFTGGTETPSCKFSAMTCRSAGLARAAWEIITAARPSIAFPISERFCADPWRWIPDSAIRRRGCH